MRDVLVLALTIIISFIIDSCQAAERCYGDLGCFSTLLGLPALPQSPDHIRTNYLLFTRASKTHPTHVVARDESTWHSSLSQGHFSKNKGTKFIIHGFIDNGNKQWLKTMKDELLKKGDFNVFIVDWGHGSKFPYSQATANTFLVAAGLSRFLRHLHDHEGLSLARVHLIGHSLGAHIAGNCGAKTHGLGRISGLDPAEPNFIVWGSDKRLDKSDATFVDVIHSDGEPFLGLKGYGLITPLGDVDFYPNGGVDQPGCTDTIGGVLIGILEPGKGRSISCSHGRSHDLFTESINSRCSFKAHRCSNWASYEAGTCHGCPGGCPHMGYDAALSGARGSYYLSTTQESPFCGHEYFVEIDLSAREELTTGRIYVTLLGSSGHSHTLEFSRDTRQYHAQDHEKHVIAVHHHIGSVSSVKVMYKRKFGIFSPGKANEIVVERVYVQDIYSSHKIKFCGHNAHVSDKQVITLTSHTGC
ncbi:inactive pancreatic lipase-related protein 1-like [Gigantopelta aegis]|uniref:inactive pancreatic lipase-related protein 1-like n=1 Tax=Gigantopelta aegis TaxID=1735272 RepID=UPI001B88B964|nr:inactive pancreatic lipase-related protein 1-like [Gigantopelta aegis]